MSAPFRKLRKSRTRHGTACTSRSNRMRRSLKATRTSCFFAILQQCRFFSYQRYRLACSLWEPAKRPLWYPQSCFWSNIWLLLWLRGTTVFDSFRTFLRFTRRKGLVVGPAHHRHQGINRRLRSVTPELVRSQFSKERLQTLRMFQGTCEFIDAELPSRDFWFYYLIALDKLRIVMDAGRKFLKSVRIVENFDLLMHQNKPVVNRDHHHDSKN